jgi:hypothetical protein
MSGQLGILTRSLPKDGNHHVFLALDGFSDGGEDVVGRSDRGASLNAPRQPRASGFNDELNIRSSDRQDFDRIDVDALSVWFSGPSKGKGSEQASSLWVNCEKPQNCVVSRLTDDDTQFSRGELRIASHLGANS